MIWTEDVYKIGRIGKPHGVNGEVSFMFADDIFDHSQCDYLVLSIDGILVPFFIESYRFHGADTALVKFCDVDTQQQAAELTGCDVFFPRNVADNDGSGFSLMEVVGYSIADGNEGNHVVGRIASVDDSTMNTLFVLEDGALIPATEEFIECIDKSSRTITMKLPKGLIER